MAEMFAKLETSIKGEIESLREDMNHILKRVEDVEITMDRQGAEIKGLKNQMEEIQKVQRNILYRLEDQENQNRRKNLRIRGLPEIQGEKENIQEKMDVIFGGLINPLDTSSKIKFERVHRIRKPAEISGDVPRDVIARFHNYQDKEQIKACMKKKSISEILRDKSADFSGPGNRDVNQEKNFETITGSAQNA